MRAPRVIRLGKVSVIDGDIRVEPEREVTVDARPNEEVALALFYDYREGSTERERVRLSIRASLGSVAGSLAEESIDDRPGLADDRRGFFSVLVRAPEQGTVDGVAEVRGAYSTSSWMSGRDRSELPVRATIPVRVRVG